MRAHSDWSGRIAFHCQIGWRGRDLDLNRGQEPWALSGNILERLCRRNDPAWGAGGNSVIYTVLIFNDFCALVPPH